MGSLLKYLIILYCCTVSVFATNTDILYRRWIHTLKNFTTEPYFAHMRTDILEAYRFVIIDDEEVEDYIRASKIIKAGEIHYQIDGMYGHSEHKKRIRATLTPTEWQWLRGEITHILSEPHPHKDNRVVSHTTVVILETYQQGKYSHIERHKFRAQADAWTLKYFKTIHGIRKFFYRQIIKNKHREKEVYNFTKELQARKEAQRIAEEKRQKEREEAYKRKQAEDKQQALWESAIKGTSYPMDYFKGINADIRNEDGLTPLMLAVKHGHSQILDMWAADGVVVDVWAKDPEGKTAWDYIKQPTNRREAIFSNRMYMALRMLEIHQIVGNKARIVQSLSGIDHAKIWIEGASCRDFCFPKYVQCIESPKIDRSGSPDTVYEKDIKRGVPPLFAAIQNHQHEKLEALLRSGEDVEQKNKFGTRPLSFAVNHHDIKSVKLLLEYGANPNVMDGYGEYSPLSVASMRNQIETVKLLLDYGADVNYQYNKSETALTVAAKGCKHFKIVQLLLEHGADPKIKDEFGHDTISGLSRYCPDKSDYTKMRSLLEDGVE